jgi:hypothetical protein
MVNIKELNDKAILDRISEHRDKGGVLDISVFEINENYLGELPDEYTAHLATARQTLEKANYEANVHWNKVAQPNNRKAFPFAYTDFEKLDPSGQKIDLHHFLGPYFDVGNSKPIVRGQLSNITFNSYFYFDDAETVENNVDINKHVDKYNKTYPTNKGGVIYALMEPPYGMKFGKEILERGQYILDFMDFFFGDLNTINIYAWDIDCSIIFEEGKEWWGSYFWTIHNSQKDWYVGILASSTD